MPDPDAWVEACLADGEAPETIALFADLAEAMATEPPPARRKLWGAGDWPGYFDERAAIREYDGGTARAEAAWFAYLDCVRLYSQRHPPIALGHHCVACAEPISVLPATYIDCDDGRTGRIHTGCVDRFRLARISRAMDSLAALGVHDPRLLAGLE
ncbi:MAG: hypothetical protein GC190_08090 [Alphaproteobacteria bacterium]|nr:hypothetical protein [Alphaproteobacteria bacterium]